MDDRQISVCLKILKAELPDRNTIINSIEAAEIETKKAFPDVSLNYELIKDYIIRTYDFLVNAIKEMPSVEGSIGLHFNL